MIYTLVCRLKEDGTVQSNVAVGTPDYISPEILRVSSYLLHYSTLSLDLLRPYVLLNLTRKTLVIVIFI